MADITQDKINDQARKSKNDTLWGKPANDILNGRDSSASAKPVRAIWEMVQNARDVSADKSNIVFTRRNGTFEFKHDGLPFINDTLNALILQTSAKVRNDGEQVGQYGTGFLTTHKFGRKFHLAGSLKLVDDEELYYCFPKFVIDRTPNSKDKMADNLGSQFDETDKWRNDLTYRRTEPDKWTVFTYLQPNQIEGENAKEAFEKAPELIPYVLCLNEGVASITLVDEVEGFTIRFERGMTLPIDDTVKATVQETPITIIDNRKEKPETVSIRTLVSKQTVFTRKGKVKPMVTVILPLNSNNVFQPSHEIARMFIYLPLIGTEYWGMNFIMHSPVFTCSTEDRSSLRLVVDGQTANDPASQNHNIISEATDVIFGYIGNHLTEWSDVHFLAPVYFDVANANKELSDYYKSLKSNWLQNMKFLPLVDVDKNAGTEKRIPNSVYVLDSVLAEAIADMPELLSSLHKVLCNIHNNAVPTASHLVYWSRVFEKWHEGETCNQIVGIDKIIDHIHKNGLNAVGESDLLVICQYLKKSKQIGYFDKNILLTEDGTLTNKTEGFKADSFVTPLKSAIKTLLPTQTGRFVKSSFADVINLAVFANKDIKDALPSCTEELQKRIKEVTDAAKTTWESNSTFGDNTGLLTYVEKKALMDYCRLAIPRNSTAFQAKALDLLGEYYEVNFDFDDSIDSDFFEWRGAMRTLICNVLAEFTILPESEKIQKKDWIKRMVTCVYGFADFTSMLQNYRIYLSQTAEFRYCKELKKDSGIPERMKDIHDTIASTEGESVECRKSLFDTEFGRIAMTDAVMETIVFGSQVMEKILASGKYLSEIDTYEHKDQIMDIINNFDNEVDGSIWRIAFETIYNDIPSLLAKLVLNKDNRDPMIKLMKIKDKTRLNMAAEIINDENMISIWKMGKDAWIEKQNENTDFEKKKELGTYVEAYLRKELKDELSGFYLKIDVDDKQGGQDIVISINEEPVYYIEVKSRWVSDKSVMMSAMQLDKSVEKENIYSLFAVDMVGYNSEDVKEHIYPDTMEEFIGRIRVVTNIGEQNSEIQPSKRNPNLQVHIGGDYKAVVPQDFIRDNHISYNRFVEEVLKPCVMNAIINR
ncbi:MAG: hypothetical protein PUG76_03955 [Prevotellaceae bacterium]|nr:hypothetical protein [Prevotellaceae bacterium]